MLSKANEYKHILGLKHGVYASFDELYNLYANSLYGFVLNMTKSPSESKDILQETFLRVWATRETISVDKSFKSFLFTIARNLIIDSFRSKVNNLDFESFIEGDKYQSSENATEDGLNYDDFLRVLELSKRKLSEKQRVIFEMNKEKGYSIEEIARHLGVSEKTIRNQLSIILNIVKSDIIRILALLLFSAKY